MARTPIYAAGGIVVRGASKRPLIAVVQRSKDEAWVLPRGKLKRDEDPMSGARREEVEETGHRVHEHEFVGAITKRARGRPKVVQIRRMQAYERPSRDVMKDIIAVEWLPLSAAVRRLSYPLEKLFLQSTGRRALKRRRGGARKKKTRARRGKKTAARRKPGTAKRPRAHKTRAAKARVSSTRARKNRASNITRKTRRRVRKAVGGAAHSRKAPQVRRERPHHDKPRTHAPALRIAAAKQAAPEMIAAPVLAPAATPPPPAKRATVLQRMLGRLTH